VVLLPRRQRTDRESSHEHLPRPSKTASRACLAGLAFAALATGCGVFHSLSCPSCQGEHALLQRLQVLRRDLEAHLIPRVDVRRPRELEQPLIQEVTVDLPFVYRVTGTE
jgi:hypothetical protein